MAKQKKTELSQFDLRYLLIKAKAERARREAEPRRHMVAWVYGNLLAIATS